MQVTQGPYDLFPTIHFEEVDSLQADMLNENTEWKLKQRIYDLQSECLNIDIVGSGEDAAKAIQHQNFLKGKIAAFAELLEDSKEAHVKITL